MHRSLAGFLIGALIGLILILVARYAPSPAWGEWLEDAFIFPGQVQAPVAIIAVDESSLQRYGDPAEWPADRYAQLLQRAWEAGAEVVALDLLPPPYVISTIPITASGPTVWPVLGAGTPSARHGRMSFPYRMGAAPAGGVIGHINLIPDPDGVLRRVPLWIQVAGETIPVLGWKAVALYIQTATPSMTGPADSSFGLRLATDSAGQVRLNYPARPDSIPIYSLQRLMEGTLPPDALARRILFIGRTEGERVETHRTPVGTLSGVEVQAELAIALLTDHILTPAPFSLTVALILGATLLSGWLGARIRHPLLLLIALLSVATGILAVRLIIQTQGLQGEILFPLIGWLTSATAAVVWRISAERGQRQRLLRLLRGRASPRLLTQLLEMPHGEQLLNADVRFIVVLFADVRGFVRLTEGQDPRTIRDTTNQHLSAFTDAVVEAGGLVTKYVGDMVAAIFNAPLPIDRPTDQALRAAQDGLQRLRQLWRERPDLLRLPMGVGIHAGSAVVGLLGSSHHQEYDAIGDTVNIAARLSTCAPAGEIYVTEAVVATASKNWSFEPLGVVQVRGRYEPVLAYRLRTEE